MSRPWLALYDRLAWARRDAARPAPGPLSLWQRLLPPEMTLHIFSFLPPASLAACACVCVEWRELAEEGALWRAHLATALGSRAAADAAATKAGLEPRAARSTVPTPPTTPSPLSWRSLFLATPALRVDGVYVSRNSYLRVGLAEWRFSRNTCHVATYFRYLRFLAPVVDAEGRTVARFWYRTTPDAPAKAARALAAGPPPPPPHGRPAPPAHTADRVMEGRWRLGRRAIVRTAMRYQNAASTEVRSRLRLRGTTPGAWNRLDVLELTSVDVATGQNVAIDGGNGGGGENDDNNNNRLLRYSRGLSTYVFVPWSGMASHVFNLPLSEMDVFIPG